MTDVMLTEKLEHDAEGSQKKHLTKKKVLLIAVATLLVLALVMGIAVFAILNGSLNSINRDPNAMPSTGRVAEVEGNKSQNFVLMGSDTRGGERGRSDVLQLVHVSGDRKGIYLISIPRDLWVEIPGYGEQKINAAYAYGGSALTVTTLEKLFNVHIHHTAFIDFQGFIRAVDTLGGVTVNNRIASSYKGNYFPKGEITLNGDRALLYVRERKNLPGGDFDRTQRQRDVIIAVFKKLLSGGVITNPVKLTETLNQLAPSFTVDSGLHNSEIIGLATELSGIKPEAIGSILLPHAGGGWSADGQSIVVKDQAALSEISTALREDQMAQYYQQYLAKKAQQAAQ